MAKTNGVGTQDAAGKGTLSRFSKPSRQAMFEEMERDPAVVMLGEDVGVYGGAFQDQRRIAGAVWLGARD